MTLNPIDLTAVIVAVIGVLGAIFTRYGVPLLKSIASEKDWTRLKEIVTVVVGAAEQLGITKVIKKKFDYAMEQTKIALGKRGIVFSDETIKAAIEAEVLLRFPK